METSEVEDDIHFHGAFDAWCAHLLRRMPHDAIRAITMTIWRAMFASCPPATWPWLLIMLRGVLGLALPLLAWAGADGQVLLAMLTIGFFSDILDGVLARELKVSTATLRQVDSYVDVGFFLCVLLVMAQRHSQVLLDFWFPIFGLCAAEAACVAISLMRFGCLPATHAWLFKGFGASLFLAIAVLFAHHTAGAMLRLALGIGGLAYLDVILILLRSPRPAVDVPSCWHAWLSRRDQAADIHSAGPQC